MAAGRGCEPNFPAIFIYFNISFVQSVAMAYILKGGKKHEWCKIMGQFLDQMKINVPEPKL